MHQQPWQNTGTIVLQYFKDNKRHGTQCLFLAFDSSDNSCCLSFCLILHTIKSTVINTQHTAQFRCWNKWQTVHGSDTFVSLEVPQLHRHVSRTRNYRTPKVPKTYQQILPHNIWQQFIGTITAALQPQIYCNK